MEESNYLSNKERLTTNFISITNCNILNRIFKSIVKQTATKRKLIFKSICHSNRKK